MIAYIVRRLLFLPVLLVAVSAVTLALGLYGPGNPIDVLLGTKNRPETVERLSEALALDRPFHEQLLRYLGGVVRGDFGESYKFQGTPVSELILPRIWVSVELAFGAGVVALVLGVALGLFAAYHQGSWADRLVIGVSLLWVSVPAFVIAPIVSFIFSRELRLLPTAGWNGLLSREAILPVLVLGLPGIAGVARLMRASVLEALGSDYVRTAQAKGLPSWITTRRHVLRNALLPIITIVGFLLAELPAGAIIVETWYGVPGIGRLAFESIFARDYPVIMATTLIVAAAYVIGNLIADLLYTVADPRLRLGR